MVALPEAESLIRKRDEAQAWARQAQKVLSQPLSESLTHEYEVGRTPAAIWVCITYLCPCLMIRDCRLTLVWCGAENGGGRLGDGGADGRAGRAPGLPGGSGVDEAHAPL